ncbi:MAG: hypothetical protein QGD92_08055 [Gammaproteobacteria bacterium]|nr:hypothetical protein [Gammaproteobacteria bacterium]
MSYGVLSLAQTPPASVPLSYMLTAPVFAIVAAILILVYPESVQNRWSPVMLSVTHLLVLGFAVMVMFGAVQQLLPVLAGVTFNRPRLVSLSLYVGLIFGVSALCIGMFLSNASLFLVAVLFLSVTVAAFFVLMMLGLLRSEANRDSIQGIRLALLSFLVSASLGLYMAAGHSLPEIPLARELTSLHLTWGLLGWIGLLVITVSYQVVPMFQITPRYPKEIVRWLTPFIFLSLVFWSLIEILPNSALSVSWVSVIPKTGVMAGLLTFCLMTLWLQHKRRRKLPDVTLDFFRLALSCMMLAIFIWSLPESWLADQLNREVLIGALLIIGFTLSVISGMLYKIVPFLIWLHLTNQIDMSTRWQKNIPNMKQIIPEVHGRWQFRLHLGTVLVMIAAMYQGEWSIRLAAVLFLMSNLYLLRNLILAVVIYRKVLISQPAGES